MAISGATLQRFFAIVPAAGRSQRMGRNKLLLDYAGKPILSHVLDAWIESLVDGIVIVIRPGESAVSELCASRGLKPLCPSRPPRDMKESIQHALRYLAAYERPSPTDRWLLAPADLPTMKADLVKAVVKASGGHQRIVAPFFGDRRGHPVSFPWSMADRVFALAANEGVDRIVAGEQVVPVNLPAAAAIDDVDTPAEYDELCKRFENR